jgi:predicted RND superfamily exporter protein
MTTKSLKRRRTAGAWILDYRQAIGLGLLAITIFFGYWALHAPIATRFEDLFPSQHPNVQLYRKFRNAYGGAQTLVLMIRVKDGDIFNVHTLHAIQDITDAVNALDGVNHNEVFSLSSYRVLYARALPGVLASAPYMYPKVPEQPEQIAELKTNVQMHLGQLAGLITHDLKGALIIASFNEGALDYATLFNRVQEIIDKYQNANTTIYASGAVMFAAWGYHYLPLIERIFGASLLLMIVLTWLCLGRRRGWWAPIVTGVCSAIWGVGFMSLRGYNFDPAMLVIPLIMTARDLGHGIQWQGRYYDELARGEGQIIACVNAADRMFRPGIVAILIGIAGIGFLGLSDIPALRQLGFGGAVWLGSSLLIVLAGQPIMMSYLRAPAAVASGPVEQSWLWRLGRVPAGGWARAVLIALGAGTLAAGLIGYLYVPIGYQTPGTPIYRPDAKINRDTAEISKFVPANFAWVVLETPDYPSPQSTMGTRTLRMADDLGAYLMGRGDAVAVQGFGDLADKPMNQLLHNGSPKFLALPDTEMLSATLWNFFFGASAPDEPKFYFAYEPSARNACIRILLPDHTAARLRRLRADLDYFVRARVANDPKLDQVKLRYIGGDAGLYLAIDDVTRQMNSRNLMLVLGAILVISAIALRSIVGGVLLAITAIMANLIAFVLMDYAAIGLTADTIPIISLGIGLGLSSAIYIIYGIGEARAKPDKVGEAIPVALAGPGQWVVGTFVVMLGGLLPWVFSPLLFQNEMSLLLILLLVTNLLAGIWILPAMIGWLNPAFLSRTFEYTEDRSNGARAAAS